MNAMRSLKRGVAKANMKRAGFRHVNKSMSRVEWRDYLRMNTVRERRAQRA